jgi:4'-phosphopantetheinyl transferase
MQEKVLKYRRWQDAQSSLLGKILLMRGLKKYGFSKCVLEDIQYTPYNRPYFRDNIYFNISHSGNCVICAISRDFELGIDVEEIRPIIIHDFNSQFNEEELNTIYSSEDRLFAFYNLWTKKEAIIKADGRGMSVPLKNIVFKNSREALLNERQWHVKQIDLNNMYCIHLAAAASPDNRIMFEKLSF